MSKEKKLSPNLKTPYVIGLKQSPYEIQPKTFIRIHLKSALSSQVINKSCSTSNNFSTGCLTLTAHLLRDTVLKIAINHKNKWSNVDCCDFQWRWVRKEGRKSPSSFWCWPASAELWNGKWVSLASCHVICSSHLRAANSQPPGASPVLCAPS